MIVSSLTFLREVSSESGGHCDSGVCGRGPAGLEILEPLVVSTPPPPPPVNALRTRRGEVLVYGLTTFTRILYMYV